jgi:hypothetical protein
MGVGKTPGGFKKTGFDHANFDGIGMVETVNPGAALCRPQTIDYNKHQAS